MTHTTFQHVPISTGFYIPTEYGNVSVFKVNASECAICENKHYAYQIGMHKKMCDERIVLIKTK